MRLEYFQMIDRFVAVDAESPHDPHGVHGADVEPGLRRALSRLSADARACC